MEKTEIKLPSGSVLLIQEAPFAEAKALFQATLHELKGVAFNATGHLMDVFKNMVCAGFSSAAMEQALKKCLERCTIDGLKISEELFEPPAKRGDYVVVYAEVLKANVGPFVKSLFLDFQTFLQAVGMIQE